MELTDYLADGALINILRTNSGKNPPLVWITPKLMIMTNFKIINLSLLIKPV